jgi:hypothetical protein
MIMTIKRMLALCLLAAAAALPAHADGDAVQFGSNINVARNASVQDAVCFFCSVNVEGKVTGDVVVFFGSVHLAGDAQHDVVNIFGSVSAEDNTSIGDDLVSIFGAVRLGENVSVSKDLVAIFGSLHAASTVSVGGDRVVQPAWLFWGPFGLFIVILVALVREFRAYRRRLLLRGYPFPPRP